MNCLETRRALLTNPESDDATLQAHLQECATCRTFSVELRQQERVLRDALAVPVPPHLADRVLLTARLRRPRSRGLAWVASVLLAITVSLSGYLYQKSPDSVAWCEVVLAHVLNERYTLEKNDQVTAQQLQDALAGFGLSTKSALGRIRFLDRCALPGGSGLHVVVDTRELGQVTLVLLPQGAHVADEQTARDGFSTQLVTIGDTAIGVVTQHPDRLEKLSDWLNHELQVLPG